MSVLLTPTSRAAGLVLWFAAVCSVGAAAPPLKSGILKYEVRRSRGDAVPTVDHIRVWFLGEHYRVERNNATGAGSIAIRGPDGLFFRNTGRADAVWSRQPRPIPHITVPVTDPGSNRLDRKMGSEGVNGFPADIYEAAVPGAPGFITWRQWWSRDHPSLLIKELWDQRDTLGEKRITILTSAQLNVAVPHSQFRLPKGTKPPPPLPAPAPFPAPGAPGSRAAAPTPFSNLSLMARAVRLYARDHGGKLPPLNYRRALQDALRTYVPGGEGGTFYHPTARTPFLSAAALAGKLIQDVKDPARQVMLYSPVPEPGGGRLVAYLDGRVASLPAPEWARLAREQNLGGKP